MTWHNFTLIAKWLFCSEAKVGVTMASTRQETTRSWTASFTAASPRCLRLSGLTISAKIAAVRIWACQGRASKDRAQDGCSPVHHPVIVSTMTRWEGYRCILCRNCIETQCLNHLDHDRQRFSFAPLVIIMNLEMHRTLLIVLCCMR